LRKIVVLLTAAIALLAILALAYRAEIEKPFYGASGNEVFVDIPRHATSEQIADLLVDTGILHHRLPFLLYIRLNGLGRHIQAGEYRFAEPTSPMDVARRLAKGDVSFRAITIPEGLTAGEIIELLAKNGLGTIHELQPLLRRTDWIRDIDPKAHTLEGYLFPETYRFGRNVSCETVLKTMIQQFQIRMAKLTAANPVPEGWTMQRIVILASLIEKEVKQPDEAPLVASVLLNRLEKKMPLACDATIIYGMKLAGIYQGRLGKADLLRESPYNTYLHTNLPPGPIANPGENSIRAALHPARTGYYYYVSRNDGTHQFSRDYASHQIAVNRYQKSLAKKK
jgi:UPF0755 protein